MFRAFKELNKKVKFTSFLETARNPYISSFKMDKIYTEGKTTVIQLFSSICEQVLRYTEVSILSIRDGKVVELGPSIFEEVMLNLASASENYQGKRLYMIESEFFDAEGPIFFVAEDESQVKDICLYIIDEILSWREKGSIEEDFNELLYETIYKGIDKSHLRMFQFYESSSREPFRFTFVVTGYFDLEE